MRRFGAWLVGLLASFMVLAGSAASAQTKPNSTATPLPAGQVIGKDYCIADPTQSYALYLPFRYSPAKIWPIIYAFDPGARGKVPVELYKDTAEKYCYILSSSNKSKNFQANVASAAAQAMWDDTHLRLRLDPRRIYVMGFSGGARVATTLAIRCAQCGIAGVISHGAGYPASLSPSPKDPFAYLAFIGNKDFNWPELMELRRRKEAWAAPFRLITYSGDHQWAPPDLFDQGAAWLQLKAMQTGTLSPDTAFVDQLFARTQKEADGAVQRKDAIAQLGAYRSLVSDFDGLKDVGPYQAKLSALKHSTELKQAEKKEQQAIGQQLAATQELSSKLAQLGEVDLEAQVALRTTIADGMTALQTKAEHARDPETRLVLLRAFAALWAQGIEAGQRELKVEKRSSTAEVYFQLLSSVTPDQPWPVLLLAETHALQGDKKRALKDLREAIKRGLKRPESIEEDANLQTLHSEAEFQQMVAELKARRDSQLAR